MTEFYNLVQRLTKEHRVAVTTDNGVVFAMEDGLLQQLRDAVFGDNGSNGHTSGKARLPMNAPASDLLTLIDRQVSEVWATVTGKVPNADRVEKLLIEWASAVNSDRIVTVSSPEGIRDDTGRESVIWTRAEYLPEELLRKWVQAILDLFDPPAHCRDPCGMHSLWGA